MTRDDMRCEATLTLTDLDLRPLHCQRQADHGGVHTASFGAGGYEWTEWNAVESVCEWTCRDECFTAQERGVSPVCPVHGAFEDSAS